MDGEFLVITGGKKGPDEPSCGKHGERRVETAVYPLRPARPARQAIRESVEKPLLAVGPGEQIFDARRLALSATRHAVIEAKQRLSDGRVRMQLRTAEAGLRAGVVRVNEWLTRDEYSEVVAYLEKEWPSESPDLDRLDAVLCPELAGLTWLATGRIILDRRNARQRRGGWPSRPRSVGRPQATGRLQTTGGEMHEG
jgi:hypothetical protein